MKKLLVILAMGTLIWACNSGTGEAEKDKEKGADTPMTTGGSTDATAPGATVANERGLELIGASDCTTCHQIDKKSIGPAYVDVAKRYETNDAVIDSLARKVIAGGVGNWGQVAMTAHPTVSEADAKEMVKYVLSLDNK